MENTWDSLPSDLLVDILEKFDNLQDLVAASGVCKQWKQASHSVSSIVFQQCHWGYSPFLKCKTHGWYCDCILTCLSNMISRSVCLSRLVLDYSAAYCTGLSSTMLNLISSCKSLTELEIHNIGKQKLPSSLTSRLRKLKLVGPVYHDSVEYNKCQNLEELEICYLNEAVKTSLSLPKLRAMHFSGFVYGSVLEVDAPVAKEIGISCVSSLYIHAERVETLMLYDTELVQGPRNLERLELEGKKVSQEDLNNTLAPCTVVPWIKSLKISPRLSMMQPDYMMPSVGFSRSFFTLMSQLKTLRELELIFDIVLQLDPEESKISGSFQSLDVLVLNVSKLPTRLLVYLADLKRMDDDRPEAYKRFVTTWRFLKDLFACKKVELRCDYDQPCPELMSLLEENQFEDMTFGSKRRVAYITRHYPPRAHEFVGRKPV